MTTLVTGGSGYLGTHMRTYFGADDASRHLQGKEVLLRVDLGAGGTGSARMWTCDLSAEYVRINAEYRT